MTVENLEMKSGDAVVVVVTILDNDTGLPVNLSGCTASFAMVDFWTETSALTKSTDDSGIEILDPTAGRLDVNLDAADTDALEGEYKYEIQVTDTVGNRTTPVYGTFTVLKDLITT